MNKVGDKVWVKHKIKNITPANGTIPAIYDITQIIAVSEDLIMKSPIAKIEERLKELDDKLTAGKCNNIAHYTEEELLQAKVYQLKNVLKLLEGESE